MTLGGDPIESAEEAGLRYVSDVTPGIRRRRRGRGFSYLLPDGTRLADRHRLAWIRSLAIPPAWTDVWICPDRRGHLQATGRDARGRKQYRYHPEWRTVRDGDKYGRLLAFGLALPRLRRLVARDLQLPGLPREKVLALVVRLLDTTWLRIGNAEYARENRSFGLTTLLNRHVTVNRTSVRFRFRGKAGKTHETTVDDRRLARLVARCQELPGQELFSYLDEAGEVHAVDSADVNRYLREITGEAFTAKDFRTWAGTVLATETLGSLGAAESEADRRHNLVLAVKKVADRLGNTPAVARQAYLHPAVIDAYKAGAPISAPRRPASRSARSAREAERALVRLLEEAGAHEP